jgi:PAS domain S-box-containing protein
LITQTDQEMDNQAHSEPKDRLIALLVCSLLPILTGFVVLVGWAADLPIAKSILPGRVAMNPLTAICFILAGAGILSTIRGPRAKIAATVIGLIIATIGVLRIVSYVIGHDFGLDRLFFHDKLNALAIPNRMAPNTAACFAVFGLSQIGISFGRGILKRISQGLAIAGLAVSSSAILGYLYHSSHFEQIGNHIPMAINTAVCFTLIGVGIFLAGPQGSMAAALSGNSLTARTSRRLLIPTVIIPVVLGWLHLYGQRASLFDNAYGTAMLVFACVTAMFALILWNAVHSRKIEEDIHQTQEALRQSEERRRIAVQGSNDGLWDWKVGTSELYVSPRYQQLLGYAPTHDTLEFEQFPIESLHLHADDATRISEALQSHLKTDTPFDLELRYQTGDGSYRWFHLRGQAVRDASGVPIRVAGSITDINDRKLAENEAREARSEAERANQAKSEFLSRMSHELRTPMNAVLGFAQLLEFSEQTPENQSNIEQILKAGKHLLALIDEVLDIARIEAGRLQISLEPVCVQHVIDDVLQLMKPIATERGIAMITEDSVLWESFVRVDRQRLKQVLLNLVSNAIKYNSDNGSVTLRCVAEEPGTLRIEVIDTGNGISDAHMGRLFNAFDRLDADQTGVDGTGLGLALSKSLVELMGGSISVSSHVGAGSTFAVLLNEDVNPAGVLSAEGTLDAAADSAIARPNRTILYIEDNQPNLNLVEAILRRRPEVKLLSSMLGRLGVDLAREHRPDMILLDMHLPDIPGTEVLGMLKHDERTKEIPVIIVSADALPGRAKLAREAGAATYLTKPISVKEFLSVVDETLYAA